MSDNLDEKARLHRSYGATLERILDMNGIQEGRSLAKKMLHKSLKRSKKIAHMSRMSNEDLKSLIDELNDFFPLRHNYGTNDNRIDRREL